MRYTFSSVTRFDYVVSDEDDLIDSLEIAARYAFVFLSATRGLGKLCLVFGRLVDGILLPLSQHTERQCAQSSIRLLDELTRYSPLDRIRNIELVIATHRTSLVKFLLAHRDTLRSLILICILLVRMGDPLNTWETTLAELAQSLTLSPLFLSRLRLPTRME
jgi:hypothetical protein